MPTSLPRTPVPLIPFPYSPPSVARRLLTDGYWLGLFGFRGKPAAGSQQLFMFFPKGLDLHIHARGQIKLHQRIHRLLRRLKNVEQALVSANFELLPRLLVHVRRSQHAILVLHRGQGNWPRNLSHGTAGGFDNLARRLVQNAVVVSLEPDANSFFSNHVFTLSNPLRHLRKERSGGRPQAAFSFCSGQPPGLSLSSLATAQSR